jgi:hypothetical protein
MIRHKKAILITRPSSFSFALHVSVFVIALIVAAGVADSARGQSHLGRKPVRRASICGNPNLPCKTTATFQPYDLPFRIPENAVILDTELFYGIVLKSVRANEDDCNTFVPEGERLEAQALFPDRKVFASRCVDVESLFYTNVDPKSRMMAVYGGTTLAEAKRVLAAVKATGKYRGAYILQTRTGFNGT